MKPVDKILGSKANIVILRALCRSHLDDLSVSELAREAKTDKSAVSKSLLILEKHGIILTARRGNMKLCTINRKSKYYDMLEKLFTEESYIEQVGGHG